MICFLFFFLKTKLTTEASATKLEANWKMICPLHIVIDNAISISIQLNSHAFDSTYSVSILSLSFTVEQVHFKYLIHSTHV